jgi:XrtJ-associated TM-motif-TM protein
MKKIFAVAAICLVMAMGVPAHAQSGCEDSPENPTLILAGLAGGAFAVSHVRMRLRARAGRKSRLG